MKKRRKKWTAKKKRWRMENEKNIEKENIKKRNEEKNWKKIEKGKRKI